MESESSDEDNDKMEECEEISTTMDEHSEMKEDVLDLIAHCEPTLVEEEDEEEENGYNDSLGLEAECVDPLEFLEVDQNSITESIECDDTFQAETNEPPDIRKRGKNWKCGHLKNVASGHLEPATRENSDLKNNEKKVFCGCASDKFKCKICKQFINKLHYHSHLRKHKHTREHACSTCDKTFLLPVHLHNHIAAHECGKKRHVCSNCDKSFKHLKSLRHHRLSCSKKKYYKCNECGESFPLKRSLLSHLRTHEKVSVEESFNCEICCIVFDNSSSKKEHIMQVHVAAQRFVCGMCGEAFVTESAKKRHTATHSRSYPCKLCDATFTTRRDLLTHRVQHRSLKELRCKTCGREFEQISAYMEHKLAQCCSEDRTVCELCSKTFKDKTALKKHIMVHVPISERSVLCDLCKRSFCGNSALQKHIRLIHADSRPYTCEFCSKSFNQLCKLKYHIVIHASDKPVSCDICSKAFSNEKDIKIHMRTHTGERPFKCNLCGKTFRQRGHVKTHQLVHTKEKPFNCHVCKKNFGLSSSLKKHMKLHTSNISITNV